MSPRLPTLACVAALGLWGCANLNDHDNTGLCKSHGEEDANVDGAWTLTGKGQQSACSDPEADGRFTIATAEPLTVRQVISASGPDRLQLAAAVTTETEGRFTLDGSVDGRCIEFTTVEELPGNQRLSLNFVGEVVQTTVAGEVTAHGPAGCEVNGTFSVALVLEDDCLVNQCVHGACVDGPGTFTCGCDPGYLGALCDEVDNCYPTNPCLHEGVCADGLNDTFTCACAPGYSGATCEVDACAPNPCQNGGTCTHGPVSFTCQCPAGWAGTLCDDVDNCLPNPCQNGGSCTDGINSYTCACDPGWTGPTCTEVDNCWPNPCRNGAPCVDGDDTYTCLCGAGLSGSHCETDIDECANGTAQCDENATCNNTVGSFDCACNDGYVGDGSTCKEGCTCDQSPNWTGVGLLLIAILWRRRRSQLADRR